MLVFKDIELNNFKSFKQAKLDYENLGLTLVNGINHDSSAFNSNGSAKSSLLSGLTYALFGKTGQSNEKADDIINRNEKKNTSVILNFEVGGTPYRIERYRKHKDHNNKVLLFVEDREITEKATKDTNTKIEDVIGMDYTIYTNTIMYGQDGNSKTFTEATDKEKKEILSDITRISVYAKAQQVVRDEIKETEQKLLNNETEQSSKQQEIEQVNQVAEQEKEDYKQTENSIKEHKATLESLQSSNELDTINKRMEDIESHLEDMSNNPVTRTKPNRDNLTQLQDYKQQIKDKINEFTYKRNSLSKDIEKHTAEQGSLNTATVCPSCGQPIDSEHAQKEFNNLKTKKETLYKSIEEINNGVEEKLNPVLDNITLQIQQEEERLEQEEKDNNKDYEDYYQTQQELNRELNELESKSNTILNNISREQDILSTLESVPKPRDYSDKLTELNNNLQTLKDSNTELFKLKEAQRKSIDVLSREGVQSIVLDGVTPFLNEHANKYLNELSGGTIKVDFTTQVETQKGDLKDKFEVAVENSVGANSYSSLSSGEKRRVDLAVSLAIQDLVFDSARLKTNVVFYDETFEGLDTSASESAISVLEDKAKTIGSIFVITHNDNLKPLFNNVVTVEKTNGESKVKNT